MPYINLLFYIERCSRRIVQVSVSVRSMHCPGSTQHSKYDLWDQPDIRRFEPTKADSKVWLF